MDLTCPNTPREAEDLLSAQDFLHGLEDHRVADEGRLEGFDPGYTEVGTVKAVGDYGRSRDTAEEENARRLTFYMGPHTMLIM